jgi:hypothetical protein
VNVSRLKLIGVAASVAWIASVGVLGINRVAAEARLDFITCHRIQMAVQADPRCAKTDIGSMYSLCVLKDAGCQINTPLDKLRFIAALCLGPPILGWLFARLRRSISRRRNA